MALSEKPRGRWRSRLHFLVRLLGLTGLAAAAAGLVLGLVEHWSWEGVWQGLRDPAGLLGNGPAMLMLLAGSLAALLALVIEAVIGLRQAAGRRSAFGGNAVVQVALAAALLVGVNVYSFRHYFRFDWTRSQSFTLPNDVRDDLTRLKGETTIVVYQQHKTFGRLSNKTNAYDYEAENKVVEKVNDLVEQFRELGPQFKVVILDVKEKDEDEQEPAQAKAESDQESASPKGDAPKATVRREGKSYDEKLRELPKELTDAIEKAPENSIFFYADGRVQRLSFNDFYRLDKQASTEAHNLVLRYQGVEPFARRVFNTDEKRPRIGVVVVHELLTTGGAEETLTLAGVKKSLTEHGFDVQDIIVKKWSDSGAPPEPAVFTYEENKLERLEEQLAGLDDDIKALEEERKVLTQVHKDWQSMTLDELTKKYARQLDGARVTESIRQLNLPNFAQSLAITKLALDQYREERSAALKDKAGLNNEQAAESRRMTDVKAKLRHALADCDLLFIPRMTLINLSVRNRIPNRVHRLDDGQVEAIKDFLKSGKPVLACFGPVNESPDRPDPLDQTGSDGLERAFEQLGVKFGRQTVLFNADAKAFAERRSNPFGSGLHVAVPPVSFDWEPGEGRPLARVEPGDREPNPIRESMLLTEHSVGKALDLRIRHPRPVYFVPKKDQKVTVQPEFLMTDREAWNEDQPFPTRDRAPRYEPPKPDDPSIGTLDQKRRGRFPIGVAVETAVPADWYAEKDAKPKSVRVAAIGHGGLFAGPELKPAEEQLLLNTCNWLLGRDDHLPRAENVWEYPRLELSPFAADVWHWGTQLGLPALFAYLGLVVLMVRRMR